MVNAQHTLDGFNNMVHVSQIDIVIVIVNIFLFLCKTPWIVLSCIVSLIYLPAIHLICDSIWRGSRHGNYRIDSIGFNMKPQGEGLKRIRGSLHTLTKHVCSHNLERRFLLSLKVVLTYLQNTVLGGGVMRRNKFVVAWNDRSWKQTMKFD